MKILIYILAPSLNTSSFRVSKVFCINLRCITKKLPHASQHKGIETKRRFQIQLIIQTPPPELHWKLYNSLFKVLNKLSNVTISSNCQKRLDNLANSNYMKNFRSNWRSIESIAGEKCNQLGLQQTSSITSKNTQKTSFQIMVWAWYFILYMIHYKSINTYMCKNYFPIKTIFSVNF